MNLGCRQAGAEARVGCPCRARHSPAPSELESHARAPSWPAVRGAPHPRTGSTKRPQGGVCPAQGSVPVGSLARRGGHSPCLGQLAHIPAAPVTGRESPPSGCSLLPLQGKRTCSHPTLQNPGKVCSLGWVCGPLLWSAPPENSGPPAPVAGPQGGGSGGPGAPSPLPGQASTPWLSKPAAAEFNAGSGWAPAL